MNKSKLWFIILAWTSSVSADDHLCSPCKPDVPAGESKQPVKLNKDSMDGSGRTSHVRIIVIQFKIKMRHLVAMLHQMWPVIVKISE